MKCEIQFFFLSPKMVWLGKSPTISELNKNLKASFDYKLVCVTL